MSGPAIDENKPYQAPFKAMLRPQFSIEVVIVSRLVSVVLLALVLLINLSGCNSGNDALQTKLEAQSTEIAALKASFPPTATAIPTTSADPSPRQTPLATPFPGGVSEVFKKVAPSVVRVKTADSEGTGFVAFTSEQVITAFHIVGDPSVRPVVVASDGTEHNAVILGADELRDIALLFVPSLSATPLPFSRDVSVGDAVIAVGYAAGLPGEASVTRGIVSARRIETGTGLEFIQTDTPINPGNSGGPLVSEDGQVIGVNLLRLRGHQAQFEGMGFAIAASEVQSIEGSLQAGVINLIAPTAVQLPATPDVPPRPPMHTPQGPIALPTVATASPTPVLPETGTLLIRLLWYDGSPIAGCKAQTHYGTITNTQADGTAVLTALPPGTVGFNVTCAVAQWTGETAEIQVGQTTVRSLTLTVGSAQTRMVVTQPMPNSQVGSGAPALLAWLPISDAAEYRIGVYRYTQGPDLPSSFERVFGATVFQTNCEIPASVLMGGNEYQVRVEAYHRDGWRRAYGGTSFVYR